MVSCVAVFEHVPQMSFHELTTFAEIKRHSQCAKYQRVVQRLDNFSDERVTQNGTGTKTQAKQFLIHTFPFFRFCLGICPFRYVKVNHHLVLLIVIRLSFALADSNKSSVIILDIMLGHIK